MADVEVNLKVKADTNALTAIKKELKEMKALALNGDGAAAKRVAELTDKLEDLKDTTKSLKGDGVERLQNSFSLLNESLRTGDMEKFKTGLKGVGSAMSAIPLLLIIEGLKALFDNFDKVIEAAKVFFSAFSEGEKKIKSLNRELERQKNINQLLVAGIEDEIKILEAQGASQSKINQKKRESIAIKIKELEVDAQLQLARVQEIIDNDSLTEAYYRKTAAVLQSFGEEKKAADILKLIDIEKRDRAKDALDKFKADSIAIHNLKTEIKILDIKDDKDASDRNKKKIEDAAKLKKELFDNFNEAIKNAEEETKKDNDELDKRNENRKKAREQDEKDKAEWVKKQQEEDDKINQKKIDDAKKLREDLRKEQLQGVQDAAIIENSSLQSLQALSDTYFSIKQANIKKGSIEEEAAAKKQFQINKALQLATAAVNGAQAITAILAVPDFSLGVISAIRIATAVATTAATIAKISAMQFNTSGFASSAAPQTPRSNISGGNQQTPSNQQVPTQQQQSSQFDENGKKINERPIIVKVSEINDVQRKVARVDEQSRF